MNNEMNIHQARAPKIVIIGAGFAGISLAIGLRNTRYQVIVIDKNNYHTFQPLLYQVATSGLEPDSIAFPVRRIFRKAKNIAFRTAEVIKISTSENKIQTNIGDLHYDYLIIATGSENNFFNLSDVQEQLMPMKTLMDALNLRNIITQNLEKALLTKDKTEQEELINIIIVGGGPTGVELAGALSEMKKYTLPRDFPELNFERMHIYIFEAAPRILSAMSEKSSDKAFHYLKKMGVKIAINAKVVQLEDRHVVLENGEKIPGDTVIWSAGVKGATIPGMDAKVVLPNGRLKTNTNLQVNDYPNVFAIGDIAMMETPDYPKGHPMLAQTAIQQGKHLAKNFRRKLKGLSEFPFEYKHKGAMATVGRNKAVADFQRFWFHGTIAWFLWMLVHLLSLTGFRNKMATLWNWFYNYITYDRNLGIILFNKNKIEK